MYKYDQVTSDCNRSVFRYIFP